MICGDGPDRCFVANGGQFDCISDMVINKIWAAKKILELGNEKNRCEHLAGILDLATHEMDEVLAWAKYLQTRQDRQLVREDREALCRRS